MPNEAHIIALAGNPNVGKSTVFNALTGLRQHTGNWPGKTVAAARGDLTYGGERFTLVDLPGTYSLFPNSAEEEIARDYLCSGEAEAVLILADATCLERSLNLVLQTLEAADVPAVVCVNLLDEAAKKGFALDLPALSHALGVPVVGTAASCGEGLEKLRAALAAAVREKPRQRETAVEYPRAVERAVRVLEPALAPFAREQSRFYALRLLEDDALFFTRFGADLPALAAERIGEVCVRARAELGELTGDALRDALVGALSARATELVRLCERRDETAAQRRDRRLDRLLTSRATGIPVMLALFGAILWLTVEGANVPSQLLSRALFSAQEPLRGLLAFLPPFWRGALVDGMYRTLAWVVSVMLPPMAIFFPLFTLLEDVGYLPRVAFVLDRCFAPRRGARAAEPDDVHGSRLQRLRRDGLPHHRLAARAAHRDADEQPCAVQRALSAAHHAFDRVPFRRSHARCKRRTARVAGALRVRDAARLAPSVRHAAARRKLRLFPRAAALPPSARGAGAGALASGSDGIRPRPRGDGRRARGPAHLSAGELHRGRHDAARARRGSARSAGARTGAGRYDPARLSARLSRE